MSLELLQTIPNWQVRLERKILEKRAFYGQQLLRASGHGMGIGAKWGAGLGAIHGAGSAAVSDDPDRSVLGGAIKGGIKGTVLGAGAGALAGPAIRYGPGYMKDLQGKATLAGYPGLAAGAGKPIPWMERAQEATRIPSPGPLPQNLLENPGWFTNLQGWAGP